MGNLVQQLHHCCLSDLPGRSGHRMVGRLQLQEESRGDDKSQERVHDLTYAFYDMNIY